MPKVSVIIPVYNTAKYLEKCLESVCNQTLQDIEILCINDASPDNSLEILKAYASRDARLKIIDFKKNKGVSIARNTAMKQATGEYIGFVDSDDWIDLDFYEKLYTKAKEVDSDLVIGEGKLVSENKIIKFVSRNFKEQKTLYSFFTLGLYNRKLVKKHNLCFTPNCIYGEDRLLPIKASYYAKNFTYVDSIYYHYFMHNNSATQNITNKKIENFIYISQLIVDFLNSVNFDTKRYNIIIRNIWSSLLDFFFYTNTNSLFLLKNAILNLEKILNKKALTEADFNIINAIKKRDDKALFKNIILFKQHEKILFLKGQNKIQQKFFNNKTLREQNA